MSINMWTPVQQAPHPSTVSGLSILGDKILQAIRYEKNTGGNNVEINISRTQKNGCAINFNSDNNISQIPGTVGQPSNFDGHGQLDVYYSQYTDVEDNHSIQQNCPTFGHFTTVDDLFDSSFIKRPEKSTDDTDQILTGIVENTTDEVGHFPSPDMEFNDGVLYSTPFGGIIKKTDGMNSKISNRISQTNLAENTSQSLGSGKNIHDSFSLGLDDLFVTKSQSEPTNVKEQCFKMVDNNRKPQWFGKKPSRINKLFKSNTKITSYFPMSKRPSEINETNQFNKCKTMENKPTLTPNLYKKSILRKSTLGNDLDSFYNKEIKSDTWVNKSSDPTDKLNFKPNTKTGTFRNNEILGENVSYTLQIPSSATFIANDDCSQISSLSDLFSADDEPKKIMKNKPAHIFLTPNLNKKSVLVLGKSTLGNDLDGFSNKETKSNTTMIKSFDSIDKQKFKSNIKTKMFQNGEIFDENLSSISLKIPSSSTFADIDDCSQISSMSDLFSTDDESSKIMKNKPAHIFLTPNLDKKSVLGKSTLENNLHGFNKKETKPDTAMIKSFDAIDKQKLKSNSNIKMFKNGEIFDENLSSSSLKMPSSSTFTDIDDCSQISSMSDLFSTDDEPNKIMKNKPAQIVFTQNLAKKSILGKSTLENDLDGFSCKETKSDSTMIKSFDPIDKQKYKSNTKTIMFQNGESSSLKIPNFSTFTTNDDCSQVSSLTDLFSTDDESKKINTNETESVAQNGFSPKLPTSGVKLVEKTRIKTKNIVNFGGTEHRFVLSPSKSVDLFASQMSLASVDLESQKNSNDIYRNVENIIHKKDDYTNDKRETKEVVESDVEKKGGIKSVCKQNESNFNARINSKLLNFAYNGNEQQDKNKVNVCSNSNLHIEKPSNKSNFEVKTVFKKGNPVKIANNTVEMKQNIDNPKSEHVINKIDSDSIRKTESEKGNKIQTQTKTHLKSIMKNKENTNVQQSTPAKKVRYNTTINVMKENKDTLNTDNIEKSSQKGILQFFPNKKKSTLTNKPKVRRDETKSTKQIKVNKNSNEKVKKTISIVKNSLINNSNENAVENDSIGNVLIRDMFKIKSTEQVKVNKNSNEKIEKTIFVVKNRLITNSNKNVMENGNKTNVVIPDMFKMKSLKSENDNNGGCLKKVSERQSMRKKPTFVPPLKKTVENKVPLTTIKAYNWITLDSQNITTMERKLNSTDLTRIVITIVYREGYTLLNKPTTCTKVSRCHPDELMILVRWQDCLEYWCCSVNRTYWSDTGLHLVGSFLQFLFSSRCKGKKVCYEAQAVCMLVLDLFGSGQGCDHWSLQDPMVGCWLLDPDNPPQDFSKALGILNMDQSLLEMPSGCDGKSQACKLLPVLEQMMDRVEQKLNQLSLWSLFLDMEMKILPVLAAMECRSICIDKNKLQETASALEMRLQALQKAIYMAAGRRFQINSHVQLRQILYDELKLDTKNSITVKQTAQQGSKSTSEPMLRLLEKVHPLPKLVLEYRQLQKVKSTYVDGILQHLNKDNTISTTWEQIGAATGRITSSNPNLQAVPKQPIRINYEGDTDSPPYYISPRAAFISRPGFTFLAADFQHIEFRVFAHYTQDEYLLGAFKQSQDIFQTLAHLWLGQSGTTERDKTKRIVYSVMYGAGAAKVAEYLRVDVDEANRIINSFLTKFPCLKSLSHKVIEQCRSQGYLHTVAGRLRLFPNMTCTNPALRSYCERQANNFLIQGSAADICKEAMLNCEVCLSDPNLNAKLLLQIHDELVWEVADDQLTIVGEKVRSTMEVGSQWGELRVPLTVAISVGKNWADMKPFSNVSS